MSRLFFKKISNYLKMNVKKMKWSAKSMALS